MVSDISLLKGKTTRFAPSVTGYLHLGHLYHLLILEKLYRDAGVKVITRLEDHDTLRRRPEYEQVILELLDWFGFEFYKDAPDVVRQSDRDAIYEEFLTKFPSESVFKCECTGFRLKTLKQNEWYEYHYDGKCHNDKLDDRQKYGLRVLFEDRTMVANEFHSADIQQNPFRQIHSSILKSHIGQWSYQYAVVVDDIAQGVELVVRGEDVMHTTGRYMQIAEKLGYEFHPTFMHHPLIYDSDKQKLSKRFGSDAIHVWKSEGRSKESILAKLFKKMNPDISAERVNLEEFLKNLVL